MSDEINYDDRVQNLQQTNSESQNNFDPLKVFGILFLIFSISTVLLHNFGGPDVLKFGAFILATMFGILCWQQTKQELGRR